MPSGLFHSYKMHASICHFRSVYFVLSWSFLTPSVPNFRRQLSSAFFFNKLLLEKKFIRKVERLNVKQSRSRWDGSYEPSHLDLCCLQKPISIACGSEKVKELALSIQHNANDQGICFFFFFFFFFFFCLFVFLFVCFLCPCYGTLGINGLRIKSGHLMNKLPCLFANKSHVHLCKHLLFKYMEIHVPFL